MLTEGDEFDRIAGTTVSLKCSYFLLRWKKEPGNHPGAAPESAEIRAVAFRSLERAIEHLCAGL